MPRTTLAKVQVDPEDEEELDNSEEATEATPRRRRTKVKTVHHWAKCWYGTPDMNNSMWYNWQVVPEEIEVTVQEYGDPKWAENLFTDLIDAGKELLDQAPEEVTATRLRVNLYSHRNDGSGDARFTLEHITKR